MILPIGLFGKSRPLFSETPMTREFPKNNPPENTSPKIALPTVGRIVLVYDRSIDTTLAAIVAKVNMLDPMVINVGAFDENGCARPMQQIRHVSEKHEFCEVWWDWMDYQKGQAAKTEQLEAQLKTSTLP